MKFLFSALCAGFLLLTGCTGQAEPAVAASGAASSSAVESSSEPEPSDEVESSSEPESSSESETPDIAASSSEPESSDAEEAVSEPAASSAAESSSTVSSASVVSSTAEPSSMPESSSEPAASSAVELSSEPEPYSSDPDKIPPGEPVGPSEPPPPLTPEEIEERRRGDEKQAEWNRLAKRLAALGDTAEEVLPPDIFNDSTWRNVQGDYGDYGTVDAIILYVTDEAVARELLEPYADPEIPYLYQEVKYTRAEIDAIFEDVKSQEIIQKYEKQGKIHSIDAKYKETDRVVEVCAYDPEPELERWLKTYQYSDFVLLSDSSSKKRNPA